MLVAAAGEDGGAVEEAGVAFFGLLHGGEEAAELLKLGLLDHGELLDLGFVFAVMRGVVVSEGEAIELGASGVAHREEDDAGGVRLEGEACDVEPKRFAGDDLFVVRISLRRLVINGRFGAVHPGFGAQEVLLGLANGAEHEFHSLAVFGSEFFAEALRLAADLIEDAAPGLEAMRFGGDFIGAAVDEELLEDVAWAALAGHGHAFFIP